MRTALVAATLFLTACVWNLFQGPQPQVPYGRYKLTPERGCYISVNESGDTLGLWLAFREDSLGNRNPNRPTYHVWFAKDSIVYRGPTTTPRPAVTVLNINEGRPPVLNVRDEICYVERSSIR